MNKKQLIIIWCGIIAVILIVIFTPRYKISWIDSQNFVQTEQTSTLYKRSKGVEKRHWDKIALTSGITLAASILLVFALREKHGKNTV
jgi:hypothetical protein